MVNNRLYFKKTLAVKRSNSFKTHLDNFGDIDDIHDLKKVGR